MKIWINMNTGNDYIKKLLSDENIKKFQEVNPEVDRMTLLSIGNSAIRPAGASYREDLAHGVVRKTGSPAIDDFLSDTFGYLVFQCQIIDFLHLYCGFTMGEADIVRRGFAKKTGTDKYIPRIKDGFIKTMVEKYGSTKEKAEEDIVAFIQVIEDASRYLFSKNHSQPYSFEGYVCGYLRTYYPLEFLTVSLNVNKDKAEKTQVLTTYAQSIGISIKSPVFRKSKAEYFCDKYTNTIYKGVESLKFLNGEVGNQLYEIGKEQIKTFIDLLLRISIDSVADSRQLTTLIKIGYFTEFGSVGKLMTLYETFCKLFDKTKKAFKKQIKRDKVGEYNLTEEFVGAFSHKITEKTFMMVDIYGILTELEKQPYPEYPAERLASFQQVILGNVDVIDAKASGVCVVGSVDDKYTPKLSGYSLKNGGYIDFKVPKRAFDLQKLVEGDVIKIIDYMFKPCKTKNEDGKWVDVPNSKELWILNYVILYESELRKQ